MFLSFRLFVFMFSLGIVISCVESERQKFSKDQNQDNSSKTNQDNETKQSDDSDLTFENAETSTACQKLSCVYPPNACYKNIGRCVNGKCEYSFDNQKNCDDENNCTADDICTNGICKGIEITCNHPPQQCYEETGECRDGNCVYHPLKKGDPCMNEDPCIISSQCIDGTCIPKDFVVCDQPANQCYSSQGICNSKGECEYQFEYQKVCDDNNSCTYNDTCVNGDCFGSLLECDTSTQTICIDSVTSQSFFQTGICLDAIGQCEQISQTQWCAFGCDHSSGICKPDPCNLVKCDHPENSCFEPFGKCVDGDCVYQPNNNNSCDDNNICTQNFCIDGKCISSFIACNQPPKNHCADDQHFIAYEQTGTCEPLAGCQYSMKENFLCENGCVLDTCYPKIIKTQVIASNNWKYPSALSLDSNDNIIIFGKFFGDVDFDPEASQDILMSAGDQDLFLSKFDANGNYLWTKTLGGLYKEQAYSMAVNSHNDIIIAGSFQGIVDFDPGIAEHFFTGDTQYGDEFLLWLDHNGNFLDVKIWSHQNIAPVSKISIDSNDNIFIAGEFFYSFDFDFTAHSDNKSIPFSGGYLLKILFDGSYGWSHIFAGNNSLDSQQPSLKVDDITIDQNDDILVIGSYIPHAVFQEPIPNQISKKDPEETQLYLLKLSNDNQLIFTKSFESGNWTINDTAKNYHLSSITVSSDDTIIISRIFAGQIDFHPDSTIQDIQYSSLTSSITPGIAIIKLDSYGDYINTRTFEVGSAYYRRPSLITSFDGKIFIGAAFQDKVVFDFHTPTYIYTAGASHSHLADLDTFWVQMESDLSFHYARILSGNDWQQITGIQLSSQNKLILLGFFWNTLDFGNEASNIYTSSQNADIFLQIIDL